MKQRRSRTSRIVAMAIAVLAVTAPGAAAAEIDVACGNVPALRAAITTANSTPDPDTINVTGAPCNFDVGEAVVTQASGNTGLPIISRPLTINGNGATVRRTGAANYRLFVIATPDFSVVPRVVLRDLTVSGGRLQGTTHHGAGVFSFLAELVLERVNILANSTTGRGGGLTVQAGSLDAREVVIGANSAAAGGGLYAVTGANAQIARASVFFNHGTTNSGAMMVENSTATVENSTVAANTGTNGLAGITAWSSAAGQSANVTVRSSTLGDNGAPNNTAPGTSLWTVQSGGPATITAEDTVVVDANSTAQPVSAPCLRSGGTIVSAGGNVEWPTTTCGFEIQADPRVAYLFSGRGGTELFAKLQAGSAAIDAGGEDCPEVDQRGEPRPGGEACDSGSWETQPPQTSAEVSETPTREPEITFSSDQEDSTFECRVDGGDWTACGSSPFRPDGLEDGEHTVEVRATNPEGDVDATPASVTFVVDTTAPEVTIEPVESPQPAGSDVQITFTAEDSSELSSVTCQVDDAEPVACESPFNTGPLAPGEHTVTVTATDAAGNSGSDSVTFTVAEPPPPAQQCAVIRLNLTLLGTRIPICL